MAIDYGRYELTDAPEDLVAETYARAERRERRGFEHGIVDWEERDAELALAIKRDKERREAGR